MPLAIGSFNELEVTRESEHGVYLGTPPDDVLLPVKYVPDGTQIGDRLRVFVYTDSEDRPVATTRTPHAVAGELALLPVVEVGKAGAFLDWGLEKDLLAPFREQAKPMIAGKSYVVWVYLDERSGRVAASSRIDRFLVKSRRGWRPGQAVQALFYQQTPLGYKVALEGRYPGLLYRDQAPARVRLGDRLTVYVQRVREDGRVDLMLQPPVKQVVEEGKPRILEELEAAGGFLPYHDGSDPEEIQRVFGMSKKSFKRAIGNLFKERRITIEASGIRLAKSHLR